MGNTCSGQKNKNKDTISQKSAESASYQIQPDVIPPQNDQTNIMQKTSTAGQSPQKESNFDQTNSYDKNSEQTSFGGIQSSVNELITEPINLGDSRSIPKCIESFPERIQHLLMGHVKIGEVCKQRKIVIYVCAPNSSDYINEKIALHNKVYPELRDFCRSYGYELHIVDLHWKNTLETLQPNVFLKLCNAEIRRQMESTFVIPVIFLSDSLGMQLLPDVIDTKDYLKVTENAKDINQKLLSKWYYLDKVVQPPCYRRQDIDGDSKNSNDLHTEFSTIISTFINSWPQDLRDKYLTSTIEQEIYSTALNNQDIAKNCLWINRIYTPVKNIPIEQLQPIDKEQNERLDRLQNTLKEQLNEKHIFQAFVKHNLNESNKQNIDHKQYVDQVIQHLKHNLKNIIISITEEHQRKYVVTSQCGVDVAFQEELYYQANFLQNCPENATIYEDVVDGIKQYILGNSNSTYCISGSEGSGKTALLQKLVTLCQQWVPSAVVIYRFVGISAISSSVEQLLNSIVNQCSLLAYGYKYYGTHSQESYNTELTTLLETIGHNQQLIVIIDGLDDATYFHKRYINWFMSPLPSKVKIIISINADGPWETNIRNTLGVETVQTLPSISPEKASNIIRSNILQLISSVSTELEGNIQKAVKQCTLPLYCKVIAWQLAHNASTNPTTGITSQIESMLQQVACDMKDIYPKRILSLIVASKNGICDSEMLDMLVINEQYHITNNSDVQWESAHLAWPKFVNYLRPFLQWTISSNVLCLKLKHSILKLAITEQNKEYINEAHNVFVDYFKGVLHKKVKVDVSSRNLSQDIQLSTGYNVRKLNELPYQHFAIHQNMENDIYLSDMDWIFHKACGSNCYEILEDFYLLKQVQCKRTKILQEFFENYAAIINTDGKQLYSYLYTFLHQNKDVNSMKSDSTCSTLYNAVKVASFPTLIAINSVQQDESEKQNGINMIVRLPENENFFVSVSTDGGEICVWNIHSGKMIRCIKGIPHPTKIMPIDQFVCIVLCGRELHTYDLNTGKFVSKMKGMMNQKMPYFGIHDNKHLVALSRNRMYVNLMNLETGDCVTTFKAGEDRFLNSLLVSGNGRILVCGDETQKPFPLLVWNLQSRKLLYDLRIPYHDFITSMAAITYEGNYVCCACHEIDEPSPNFIVVYDLQSGTLFKKWKPSCNTVGLTISSKASCVISGMEDARILIWDLTTGNCRWTLLGHTAGVNVLKLDATGTVCLSGSRECRDKSVRVWDLNKGHQIAVYTPKSTVTAYEVGINSKYVLLGLENRKDVLILKYKSSAAFTDDNTTDVYGEKENCGKIFNLNDA